MQCPVTRIAMYEPIPATDLIKVTLASGQVVVTGDHYCAGVGGFFIPEGAIVPEKLLREMWLWNEQTGKGRLAGKQGNRVKARDIGTIRSEGLFYGAIYFQDGAVVYTDSWNPDWRDGHDVAPELGLTFREGG